MVIQELDNLCMGCMSINKTGAICPRCGFDNETQYSTLVLPYRTILNKKFLIGKVLGKGGFGITYLAWDLVLQTAVAIKEYLPSTLVARENKHPDVVAHSDQDRTEFEYGLKQFLQEARTLAQFSHANVVRVREFFAANKTAYLVMDYYEGVSLQEFLQLNDQKLSEQESLKIMLPVLNGLAQVHQKGFLHRDIKPDNIYLVDKTHPVLLDFGAARNALGQKSLSLSVILTPGFAPFEQYLSNGNFTPSTDIYSVAATIYYMVSGIKPHEATARLQNDPMIHLAALEPSLSPLFADSIMQALSVYPEHRPQTIEAFQQQLTQQPARNRTLDNTPYKPAFNDNNFPATEPGSAVQGIAPTDSPVPKGKKYTTSYCPHCKTKNVIPEGKPLIEATCIQCRMTLVKTAKEPLSPAFLIGISLVLPLLFIVNHLTNRDIATGAAIRKIPALPVVETSAAPIKIKAPEPVAREIPEPAAEPGHGPEQAEQSPQADNRFSPPISIPKPISQLPAPEDGLPRLAPQFAIDACVGKAHHDSCVANSPQRKLPGVCNEVRGVLACIPTHE